MKFLNLAHKTLVLLLLGTITAGCGGAETRKEKYLEKGRTYFEQKNYDKAIIEIKNALQIDPKFAEAYYLLGVAEEARQNWQQAFGSFAKAIELDPNHLNARIHLGRLYLMAGNVNEAAKAAEAILASEPTNHSGRLLKATLMVRQNDVDGAIKEASKVISEDPTQTEAIGLLASIYMKQHKTEQAVDTLLKGISANPKNIPLRIYLVRAYSTDKNQIDKIEPVIKEIISLEPDNLQHQRSLALFYNQTNQLEKAEKVLRDSIQANPEDADRYLQLAEFLVSRKSAAAAEAELLAAIKSNPKMYKLRFALASLYEATGLREKVPQVYRDIIDLSGTNKEGLHARNKLAELLLRQDQLDEAASLTEEVLEENPNDNDGLLNRGRLALLRKDPVGAINALRQVLRDQPASVEANTLLMQAHLMKQEPELAKESLLKAVELNPTNVKVRLVLAQLLAQTRDIDGALKATAEALKLAPNDLDVLLARYELFAAKRNQKELQSTIADIKQKHSDKPDGYILMGKYYASQKRYEDAIREFELAMDKSKDKSSALSAIVSANIAQGKPDRAINRLNNILKETPTNSFVHELLAETYLSKKDYVEAEKSLNAAIKYNPKWNRPYINLANLHKLRGNAGAAIEVYRKGLETTPDDAKLLFQLAETYGQNRDYDKAASTYEQMLQKYPKSDVAANNLASLLTDYKGDAASLKRALELASRFESATQPAFKDTLGWVYFKTGETDKAVMHLNEVVKLAPDSPVFRYHLGMAYHKLGNVSEAKKHLSRAVAGTGEFLGKEEARETLKKIQ